MSSNPDKADLSTSFPFDTDATDNVFSKILAGGSGGGELAGGRGIWAEEGVGDKEAVLRRL